MATIFIARSSGMDINKLQASNEMKNLPSMLDLLTS